MNKFRHIWDDKRYHSADYHYKNKYGTKVYRITLDGSFTCPNRDGSKDTRGCFFCQEHFASKESIEEQYNKQSKHFLGKDSDAKFALYFCYNSSTYGTLENLKSIFNKALSLDAVELVIGTRPDCLSSEIINYLSELNNKIKVSVELGIQTIRDDIGKEINRHYNFSDFVSMVFLLKEKKIDVIAHIINNLPNESIEDNINTAKTMGKLPISGVKIHFFTLLKDSYFANNYDVNQFKFYSEEEIIYLLEKQISYLPSNIVIYRLFGDFQDNALAPNRDKITLTNHFHNALKRDDVYQGLALDENIDAVTFVHTEFKNNKHYNSALDATLGHGNDSIELLKYFDHVTGIDIEPMAIANSIVRFLKYKNMKVQKMNFKEIDKLESTFDLIVYNLGYIPNSDKTSVTNSRDLLVSLNKALNLLNVDGRIIITNYTRHQNGFDEHLQLGKYIKQRTDIECKVFDKYETVYLISKK